MLRRRIVSLARRAWQAQQGFSRLSQISEGMGSAASAAELTGGLRQPAALRSAGQQLRRQHGGWNRDDSGYEHFQSRGRGVGSLMQHRGRVLAVLGGGGVIIWWSSRQEVPYTHRKHAVLLGIASEKEIGEHTFKQVLAEARQEGRLVSAAHPAARRVARIGQRIATVASDHAGGGFSEHMQHLKWEFAVIDSPQLNAFVVPGGKVVVFSKMLELCRSDDELASVLAHETAHVLARHAAERVTEQGWITVLQLLAYAALGFTLPSGLFAFALSLPHSRKQEMEADHIGMNLAAKACFDPAAGMQVFTRLAQIEKRSPEAQVPVLLRTHPLSEARVRAIKDNLPEALQWAERAGCNARRQHFFDIFTVLEAPVAASKPAP